MSVIIRLQNLPWAANAADIRAYFNGLSIPEGGVHIVGGEEGVAFIAFSTDEDARQGMLRDGGKLKEVKIKLFLSSRAEMVKIIEQARQQTLSIQQSILQQAPAPVPVPPPNVPQSATAPVYESGIAKEALIKEPEDHLKNSIKNDEEVDKRDRRDRRDRSNSRDRKDRSRDRDRDRNRPRDRERDRRRRDRSRSRDRHRRRSRSRDRNRRSSRDRDARGRKKDEIEVDEKMNDAPQWNQNPMQPNNMPPAQMMQQMHPNLAAAQQAALAQQMVGLTDAEKHALFPNQMAAAAAAVAAMGFPQSQPMPAMGLRNDVWPNMPMGNMMGNDPSSFGRMGMTPDAMPNMQMPKYNQMAQAYNQMAQAQYMKAMQETGDPGMPANAWGNSQADSNICVEIRGLPLNASYVDVKKLFEGLAIPSDGIKMINDTHGNRTGIAYVKFTHPQNKALALNQNGKKVRSSVVEVLHLKENLYNSAVDNYKPDKDQSKRDDPKVKDDDLIKSEKRIDPRLDPRNGASVYKDSRPPMSSNCILISGLPSQCNELDVVDFFSDLKYPPNDIFFVHDDSGARTGQVYCQFETKELAFDALSKDKTMIGRSLINVQIVPKEDLGRLQQMAMEEGFQRQQFQRGMNNVGYQPQQPRMMDGMMNDRNFDENRAMFGNTDRRGMGQGGYGGESRWNNADSDRQMMNRDYNMPMRGGRGRGGMMSGPRMQRDFHGPPRRGRGGVAGGNNGPSSPYIDNESLEQFGSPGCVISLENVPFKAEINEIVTFLKDFDVGHEDIIRRFDDSGRPTGDARACMRNPADANRAVRLLNMKPIRGRPIKLSIL